jgi:uncharacterized damage-inducible protein DinB
MIREAEHYAAAYRSLHDRLIAAVTGLSTAALDWTPTPGANSLAVIVSHTMGSERFMVAHLVGVRPSSRNRDAEFRAGGLTAQHLAELVQSVDAETQEVLSTLTAADMDSFRQHREGPKTVRWCVAHALEHAAEHLGQAELTRQLAEAAGMR